MRRPAHFVSLLALLALLALGGPGCAPAAQRSLPAPPGAASPGASAGAASSTPKAAPARCDWARGWAAEARGGRGGQLLRVTTLAAGGPGSLASALAAPGPRVIVFEVGGVIDLGLQTLKISEPFVTVAGQTAPTPGITLIRGGIKVETHEVVLQHLRVRPGSAGQPKGEGWEPDGISSSSGTHHFVVDHCSTTWAVDENLSASGARFKGDTPDAWRENTTHHVTFSHNIIAEGLSHATHEKGEHSKGSLIHDNVGQALIYANLYASNVERNPFFKGGARGAVVNNLIVNPGKYALKYTLNADEWGEHPYQLGQMSVVGNVLRYGANTPAGMPLLFASGVGQCQVHLLDNLTSDQAGAPVPLLGGKLEHFVQVAELPTWPEGLRALPASAVTEYVLQEAGARPWERDAIDQRIVSAARNAKSAIIDSEQEVGGYPAVSEPARAPFQENAWDPACMTRR